MATSETADGYAHESRRAAAPTPRESLRQATRHTGKAVKPRMRLIDGRAYVEVDSEIVSQGKYRDERVHHELHDGRRWALMADVERLQKGNRGES